MRFPFLWRKRASQPELSNGGHPVPPPEKVNRLLKDILHEGAPAEPAAEPRESEAVQVPLSRSLSVGARLEEAKGQAIEAATKLIALSDAETGRVISSVAEQLRKLACRIAFVGQVKAGKSSLINVLTEQPEFLPADINPCTAVITRLSFGLPDMPKSGAVFTFFTREEWRRLSLGGRTRELTGRLFPDFDWDVLRSQVTEMEGRARAKLGASFEDLLGKEHSYREIEPGLLLRYVGTEQPDAESDEGRYSDITKSADIFLGLGAFSFPTVVIDTPGVNDPFLVRDEITRQNLEAADICVVVITARQRLSASDLNLLRMLRGLKKDRLIILVNKTDEIKGSEDVIQEIGRQVSLTLKEEFPSAHIHVVLGSAAFAQKALSGGADDRLPGDGIDAPPPDECWEEPAAVPQGESAAGLDWLSRSDIAVKARPEDYFEKSGLMTLAVAISETMNAGPIASSINAASALIEKVSRNLTAWLEVEAGLLRMVPSSGGLAEKELSAIAGLRGQLAAKFGTFSESLGAVQARKVDLIKQKLSSAVQAFIPEALASFSGEDVAAQASQIDVKLRMRLETVFLEAVEDVRNALENKQELLRLELSKALEAGSLAGSPTAVPGQALPLAPSLAALSEPAALGFTAYLTGLPGGLANGLDRSVKLPELIAADFAPIIERTRWRSVEGFPGRSRYIC